MTGGADKGGILVREGQGLSSKDGGVAPLGKGLNDGSTKVISISIYLSHPIQSYHIISYHIISYHIISYHIISYHIISYIPDVGNCF